jgi:hypothetical protein
MLLGCSVVTSQLFTLVRKVEHEGLLTNRKKMENEVYIFNVLFVFPNFVFKQTKYYNVQVLVCSTFDCPTQ